MTRRSTHPLLRPRAYVVHSPPLRELEDAFESTLEAGDVSLVVHGPPRTGKTSAARYLTQKLQAESRAVVISTFIERTKELKALPWSEFWMGFLRNMKLASDPAVVFNARQTLYRAILKAADAADADELVLMLDEAQNLEVRHLAMLKKLVDELIDEGLRPFVLLLAQPEITRRPPELVRRNLHDLVNRFFTRTYRLRGLRLDEFEGFLSFYDEARWPADGPTFAQHFVPALVSQGFRLRLLAPAFAEAFKEMGGFVRAGPPEFETAYLVAAVRLLLVDLQRDERAAERLWPLVADCVKRSGLAQARQKVGNPEHLSDVPYRL